MSDSASGSHGRKHSGFQFWNRGKAKQPSEEPPKRHRFSLRFWRDSESREVKKPFEEGIVERSENRSPQPRDEGPLVAQKLNPDVEKTQKTENAQGGPPSMAEYALHATKQTIDILKGIAELAPVPLVKNILELGLKIIEVCEAINDVQSRVALLKNHIAGLLLVIAKVTKEPNPEPVDRQFASQISDELHADLRQLKGCLDMIIKKLDAIGAQNAVLTGVLSGPNLEAIDELKEQFQTEVSRFQTLRSLHAAQDLATIQQQLVKLYGITEEMAVDVKVTRQTVVDMESKMTTGFKDLTAMLTKNATEGSTILSRMPRSPNIFFGPDLVVQRIAEQLVCGDSKRSRVCLIGPGGMGKTSTALAIMEHGLITRGFAKQHRFWVPCIGANTPTLFLTTLLKQLRAERRTGDTLDDILASLEERTDPRIILLDNFETPWHPVVGEQSDIQRILEELDALAHVSILVTMRSEFSPLERWSSEQLSPINPEDSRNIYTKIDASAGNYPELDELVDALGHHPYAITLMASRGRRSLSNPKQLLEEWKEMGTSMLSRPEEGIDHSISLSVDSKFLRNSPGALRLLQILSMLPSGVYREDLSTWVDGWQSEAIDTLRDAALVLAREVDVSDTNKIHLFVLPVVQSYMTHNSRIPKEAEQQVYTSCYQFLTQNSITTQGPNDSDFIKHASAIASQEANIQALLTNIVKDTLADANPPPSTSPTFPNPVSREQWLDALLSFSWYQRWTKPRWEIAQHVVTLAKAVGSTRSEAITSFCLGSIYFTLSKFQDGVDAFTRAQLLFESLGDDIMALRSESMALDSNDQVAVDGISKLIDDFRTRWKEHAEKNVSLKPWFLFRSGYFHAVSFNSRAALPELYRAHDLFSQVDPPCKFEMAFSNCYIARSYSARGYGANATEALSAIDSAISTFQSLYGQGLVGLELADSYIVKARILKVVGRWDEELDATLKVALQSFQELGISREIGQTLEELAEVYVRKEDWPAATLAYKEVIRKSTGLQDDTSTLQVQNAQHNLQYIAQISAKDVLADSGEDDEEMEFRKPPRY